MSHLQPLSDCRCLAINRGKEDDLKDYTDDEMARIPLESPTQLWENHREEYPYLTPDYELDPSGGAIRQRPVSRYYIDNIQNFENVYSRLRTIISNFVDERGTDFDQADLSGAGSGTFPLLSFMLKHIIRDVDEEFFVGGVGSLPSLGHEDLTLGTDANANYYANAYTALRDLMYIVDYNDQDNYPISIPIEADVGLSEFSLNEPPFDFYGLMAFREAEMSPDYREEMNEIVASLIHLFSEMGGIENFRNDPNIPDSIVHAVDGSMLEIPVENLNRFLDIKDRQEAVSTDLESTMEELESYREDRDYLEAVLDFEAGATPEQDSQFGDDIVLTARNRAENLDLDYFDEDTLEEELGRCREQIPDLERNFDTNAVVDYLFYSELSEIIRIEIHDHSFEEKVEDVWSKYRGKISDADQLDEMDALTKWEDGLQEFYAEWERSLKEQLRQLGIHHPIKKREIRSDLEDVQEKNNELGTLYGEYRQLDNAKEVVEARRKEARQKLTETVSDYNNHIEDLDDERRSLEYESDQLENQRSSIEERLETFEEERHTTLPFTNFESFNRRMTEEADSIRHFIDSGVVSEQQVAQALNYLLDMLDERVQDLDPYEVEVKSFEYLGILANRTNQGLLELDASGEQDLSPKVQEFDWIRREDLENPFVIRLLAMYGNIAFENTSEYQ
ncbi:MAG: tubulin-like doman-containing protein, partial [Halobacteriaceae archaeon]